MANASLMVQNPFNESASSGVRTDGALYNATTGLGVQGRDIAQDYYPNIYTNRRFGHKTELERMYAESWLLQRACSAYPAAGLRRWIDVKIEYEDDDFEDQLKDVPEEKRTKKLEKLKNKRRRKEMKELTEYLKRLKVKELLYKGEWFANIFGGAAMVFIVEDGQPYHEPVNIDKIKTIRSLRVLDGFNIHPYIDGSHNDPTDVEHYQLVVSPSLEEKLQQDIKRVGFDRRLIHKSRIVRFDGVEITPDEMNRSIPAGWGRSLIAVIFDVFARYEGALGGVSNMIKFWDLFTYKMDGYKELAASGEYQQLIERFAMIQRLMSFTNGIIMDKNEEAGFQSRNYGGLSDIIRVIREELIASTHIPHTQLFGESPSGLGATGESESNTWSISVDEFQEAELRPKIQRILEMVFKAKDGPTGGKEPESWSFTFHPVYPETRKQKLEAESLQASNDSIYSSLGVLTKEEIRTSRFGGPEFSFTTQLDDQTWEKLKEQEQQQGGDFDPYSSLFGDDFAPAVPQAPAQAQQNQAQASGNQTSTAQKPEQPPGSAGSPASTLAAKPPAKTQTFQGGLPTQGGNVEDPMEKLFQRRDSRENLFGINEDSSIFGQTTYSKLARKYNVA